mmetsp:Transcript_31815/g.45235  ORF Transcript_31815/g.45235 Transcript_31815/m.45235 type:complete len:96 (-) Transcript_31815:31-318(-)
MSWTAEETAQSASTSSNCFSESSPQPSYEVSEKSLNTFPESFVLLRHVMRLFDSLSRGNEDLFRKNDTTTADTSSNHLMAFVAININSLLLINSL